jgi:hypothetical protein
MLVVGLDRDLPSLPGTRRHADRLQHDRKQPRRHLLAGSDHRIIFARIVKRRGLLGPFDELIGVTGHCGDNDSAMMPRFHFALHMQRDIPNPIEVANRRPSEFHHQNGHELALS